jgi:hypothetical protein
MVKSRGWECFKADIQQHRGEFSNGLGWNGKTSKKDQKGQVLGCSLVEICTAMEHGRFLNKKTLFFHSYVNLPDGRIQCNWAVSKKLVG